MPNPRPALPDEVIRTGTVRVALSPGEALDLFTARGEIGWAPGWWPRYVTPADGEPREGGVWLTEQEGQEVIWRVERFDRAAGAAEYLRITPGNRLVTVEVDCRPSGEHTAAIVRYRAIALSESGRQWLDGFTEEHYAAMMAEWETLIAAHLAAR